jgi:hypothetical protein
MPNCASDGPVATTATVMGVAPPTTNPPIMTSLPVSTRPRVEMLTSGTSVCPTSYTPATATPVPLPAPETIAVYAPGGRLMRITDSAGCDGAKPLARIVAMFAADPQSSLVAMTAWSEERTSVRVGLASAFAMPSCVSDGPVATIATVLLAEPPITNPAIITSLPVSTCMRVETLTRRTGSACAVSARLATKTQAL